MARTPAPAPATVPRGAALGMLETFGLVAAIEAADAMLKASDVQLVRQQRVVPGLITHVVVGETAAVMAAVEAGRAAAERVGKVAGAHVIPRPDPSVWRLFGVTDGEAPDAEPARSPAGSPASAAPTPKANSTERAAAKPKADATAAPKKSPTPSPAENPASADGPSDDYEALTVRELRTLARERDGGLEGRSIARASKSELIASLRRAEGGGR